jgi:hypothetical protein
MPALHIKAVSGARPVSVAAVRTLLADGRISPDQPVLSLDGGRTWQPVSAALAVADAAVDDAAIEVAERLGGLHPLAIPAGVLALGLGVAGIAFGGGGAAPAIRALPDDGVVAARAIGAAGADLLADGAASACSVVAAGAALVMGTTSAPVAAVLLPPPAADPAAPPPDRPAPVSTVPAADVAAAALQEAWQQLAADGGRDAKAWQERAESLAARTVAVGIQGWTCKPIEIERVDDEQRARLQAEFPKAKRIQSWALVDVAKGDGASIELMLVVEDEALAKRLDGQGTAKPLRIDADCFHGTTNPDTRTVSLLGYLKALP